MVMIVEDGTIVTDANSYVSTADMDTYMALYHIDDGVDASTATSIKENILIMATRSVDLLYGRYFKSMKLPLSVLLFPRYSYVDNNGSEAALIPKSLKDAVCEIALILNNGGDIFPEPNTSSSVESSKIKIGPIELSDIGGKSNVNTEKFNGFYFVEQILRPIIKQTPFITNLSR
jgi:hypothetical protein